MMAAANPSPWLSAALPLSSDEDSDCDGGDTAGTANVAQVRYTRV